MNVVALLLAIADHADLVQDVIEAVANGTPKEAIRLAIRAAKVQASDHAFKEELGL